MKTITVVGVGALGSHVVPLLRNVGAAVRIIDCGQVKQKSPQSQFHSRPSVRKGKAFAFQQLMNFLWSWKIEAIPHKLEAANVNELLGKSDLILDCLDNGAARRLVQGYARANEVPCLHGALAAEGGFGRVVWDEGFVIDDEPGDGAPTCEDGAHLTFISVTSSYLAHAAKEFLVNGRKLGFQVMPTGGAVSI